MGHVDAQELEEARGERTPPQPAPDRRQSMPVSPLAWASAVGNQAVQRLARQHDGPVEEVEPPGEAAADEVEPAEEEGAAPSLPPEEAESLAALGDDAETLPE